MNRYTPHVYVIPEDPADRQLAVGFVDHYAVKDARVKVMPPARGWPNVLRIFQDEYIKTLRDYPLAHVVMVIDFDGRIDERRADFEQVIPDDLSARVFVIGSKENPEALKRALGFSYEEIGNSLANDCDTGATEHWDHDQLQHNDADRQRLVQTVRAFLF